MLGIGLTKHLPLIFFLFGLVSAGIAITVHPKYGLFFLVPILPLQSLLDKMPRVFGANNFVDIMLVCICIGWGLRSGGSRLFENNVLSRPIRVFILVSVVGFVVGTLYLGFEFGWANHYERLKYLKNYLILPLLYYCVFNNMRDLSSIKVLIVLMALATIGMDYHFWGNVRWRSFEHFVYEKRGIGTFSYLGPNECGAFFAQYTFVIMGLLLFERSWVRKVLFSVVVLTNIYCLIFTFSRGAYVGFVVGMGIICSIKARFLMIPFVILLFCWRAVVPGAVVERVDMTRSESGELDHSAGTRLEFWSMAADMFKRRPIFGCGFQTFENVTKKDTHNMYMKTLAELGVLGLAVFVSLFYLMFRESWKLYRASQRGFLKGLGLGFAVCVIVAMVTNMFGDRWSYVPLSAYYWVFAALVVRANQIVAASGVSETDSAIESVTLKDGGDAGGGGQ